ncbi:twinkle homolog protein, chloroplastic/mitochondrial-like isoform X2 [Aristolochia californica]|uniref:twinkle homolog protein, chloroplastic/mitochondrial-like isoform X2 n=1 Tax=Aristolochia californica TaxID=171875 RepID=UPI0035D95806
MHHLSHPPLRTLLSSNVLMAHKLLLKSSSSSAALSFSLSSLHRFSHVSYADRGRLLIRPPRAPASLRNSRFFSLASVMIPGTAHLQTLEDETRVAARLAVLKKRLEAEGISCGTCKPGQYGSMLCPQCAGGDSKERSFSLFIREDGNLAMWSCFRAKCGWKGSVSAYGLSARKSAGNKMTSKSNSYRIITEENLNLEPLCPELLEYFNERMISGETLRRNGVMQLRLGDEVVIAFAYRRNGSLVSCKYRTVSKKFWQESGTEKILYGVDDIKQANDIIIVEGEMDKLSMEEAGFRNCVSVPDGAPAKVSEELPAEEEDKKYQYLWNCKDYLEKASRITLATDADAAGQALAEELARRLGRERCWRVRWPQKNATEICKDANEVLMYLGPDALKDVIKSAELFPVRGLFRFDNYFDEIDSYYTRSSGYEMGASSGWKTLDEFYRVAPGELTIVTGVPSSGKSEWIDALMVNLNESKGWKFAVCSMENQVREHARKLMEKYIRKPFFTASYGGDAERMSAEELNHGKEWLNETFYLIRCEDDCLPSIKWVLELAKVAVLRYGARGLVIDPYNELDHQRPSNQTETEYVSQMLTRIKRFAQHHACHVWFVAHPRQLQNWTGGPPNLYDISGSAHFINKCDNGIVVHRNRDPDSGPLDEICVRKVRNKVVGKIGEAILSYSRATGEFKDIEKQPVINRTKRG